MAKKRKIKSYTYHTGSDEQIRSSACLFAEILCERLISISETYDGGFLKVTVYFWKVE